VNSTTSWIAKLNSDDPRLASGKISRGRYTFLISPALPTIEPVPVVTVSENRPQAVNPV
jgi:hypothetical protein